MSDDKPTRPRPTASRSIRAARISTSPRSSAAIGIRFRDRVRKDVEEYSISEGWIRVQAGKTLDRNGRPLTLKLNGPVEAWFEDLGDEPPVNKA